MQGKYLDVTFDFTADSPGYWDGFWENNQGLGAGGCDPDAVSATLRRYHRLLWSRRLPNGERMELMEGPRGKYLIWKDFCFGSDSITASFRYRRYREMLSELESYLPDYRGFMEDFIHSTYTIGGMIIFPKHKNSINQHRGRNQRVQDRWDLTLECIRRFYLDEPSPLYEDLLRDKDFFDLFLNFKGYVDFFLLQDCVSDDYASVNIWCGNGDFAEDPLPKTVAEYLKWIDCQLDFVEKRNHRIQNMMLG